MNGHYIPNDIVPNNLFNFNLPSVVQFFHRNIAYLIFGMSVYLGFNIFKKKQLNLYNNFYYYFLVIFIQIILGILVLVSGANIYFASAHQVSSIFLVLAALSLYYRSIKHHSKGIYE